MVFPVITEPQTQAPSWQWQNWNGLPYLTCSLLQDWQHGFFTQQFYPRSPEFLVEALQPSALVCRVKQVHGNRVLVSTEMETATEHEADGIMTAQPQQSVWVASADCTPVLIGDVQTGRVAAIHAGWRGTAQRIIPEAVTRFLELGSDLDNLRIAMGPAITGEVYQVTEQVAAEVGSSLLTHERADTSEAILAALQKISESPISDDTQPGRVRLDVRRVNVLQLEQLGIDAQQIAIAPYCTYQQPEYFFSYRRTQQKQVQWSGIVSKNYKL
ncbi:MAG: peptidoglycan editing factor PgeF [Brasilonema sp.]